MASSHISNSTGYRYLKTGDESGDLCDICGRPLIIDKTNKKWTLHCYCGRNLPFISNTNDYYGDTSVFK